MQVDDLNNIRKERKDTLGIAEFSLRISPEGSDSERILKNIIQNWNQWPLSKLNRWLGYAQCCLVTDGITTVSDLRQISKDIITPPVATPVAEEVVTKKKKKKKSKKKKEDS